jgi:hypothetical protein
MRYLLVSIFLGTVMLPWQAIARAPVDQMCAPLRAFVASVKPRETRSLEFRTSWGGNFKDSAAPAIYAKRCAYHDYVPAKAICGYLMKYGRIEFSGNNVERALACLSPGTQFGQFVQLNQAEFTFTYGSDERGSNVTIQYDEDLKIGGEVLTITADGY